MTTKTTLLAGFVFFFSNVLLIGGGCSTPRSSSDSLIRGMAGGMGASDNGRGSDDYTELMEGLSSEAKDAIKEDIQSADSRFKSTEMVTVQVSEEEAVQIPVEMNGRVQRWVHYFTVKDRERFQRFLERGEKYREVVQQMLRDAGLPEDLYYLAMIESGYATHAHSHASAVGVWQFIPGTGRRYGLDINYYVDERRDPIRATDAAARYLNDLHRVFNSWYLAMAAYNAGEGRIMGAIMRGKSRNFWVLAKRGVLPKETMNYVPKFLAAVIIGKNPTKYGFTNLNHENDFPSVEAVELPAPVRLEDIARVTNVDLATLKKINPHIRRGVTPPGSKTYEVWLPSDRAVETEKYVAALESARLGRLSRRVASNNGGSSSSKTRYHRVRRGETLSSIARRYHVSVRYLKRINGLRSGRILAGTRLRVKAKSYQKASVARYRVQRGDNLHVIARRFGMSVTSLKRMNRLRRNVIYRGQVLKVRPNSEHSDEI